MSVLTLDMMGGLGNQLFQIATAYAHAKENGFELVFSDTWDHKAGREPIWNYYFKSNNTMPWNIVSRNIYQVIHWRRLHESGFLYDPIRIPLGLPYYMLCGYFQSSKYFGVYTNEIRSILQIHDDYIKRAEASLADVGIHDVDGWIVAHVRRGDYLELPQFHVVTGQKYFKDARAEIAKRVGSRTVCWISEDMDWVYKNVYEQGDIVMNGDTMTDFATLSLFRHVIMSNSSYSWWATWLNTNNYDSKTRVICCPDKWFGPTGHQNVETIFEPEWIRISC